MPTKKGKKLDTDKLEQHMGAYAEKSPADLLDQAFGRWDQSVDTKTTTPYLDRADHIIINGRPAKEHLLDNFNEAFKTMRNKRGEPYKETERVGAFGSFYKEKGRTLLNQLVSRALTNGEKVEVFVPDKVTGQIEKTPMILSGKGYQHAETMEKPAKLNRWQKFWSKLGFYKKERAAIQTYEARQKVQFNNKVARANLCTNTSMVSAYNEELKQHHPEVVEDMRKTYGLSGGDPTKLGQKNGFKTDRSSFHAIAIAHLATQRDENGNLKYTNEQLFDMKDPAMQKVRADAMKEVYDHYKAGDTDWLVDLQHKAVTDLTNRADEQAKKLDFSKPNLTEQKGYREFAMLSDTAFDQSQDMNATQNRLDEKYGKGTYSADTAKISYWSQLTRQFNQSLRSQKTLHEGFWGNTLSKTTDEVANVMGAQAVQQHVGKTLKENPGQKFSDIANDLLIAQSTELTQNTKYDDMAVRDAEEGEGVLPTVMQQSIALAQEKLAKPEQFNEQIRSGVLENRIQFQGFTDELEEPAKMEIRDAKTAEREMKQASQQPVEGAPVL